jgi:hypothetical protein
MARKSDTRTLTRKAAAALVADGRLPHTLTVDQIYAVIRQGSRTTINDELKRWKAERAQADALAGTLPPLIAESMRTLWATAVDQGMQQYAVERTALVQDRDAALADHEAQGKLLVQVCAQREALAEQVATLTEVLKVAQEQHASNEAARAAAAAEGATLRETLDQERQQGAQERAEARARLDAAHTAHQGALKDQAQAFRQELDRTTERLEHAEGQMLKQIDDARVARRRAEAQLAKAREQNVNLRTELAERRQRAHHDQKSLAAAQHALVTTQEQLVQIEARAADRERALISTAAQAEAAQRVIGTLETALKRLRRARPRSPRP